MLLGLAVQLYGLSDWLRAAGYLLQSITEMPELFILGYMPGHLPLEHVRGCGHGLRVVQAMRERMPTVPKPYCVHIVPIWLLSEVGALRAGLRV